VKNRLLVSVPLFVGLLGLGACSSEQAIPTDIKVDPIEWSTCDEYPDEEMIECGVLEVPLDYSDLEGETLEIALLRIPASSNKAKGVVLTNPGGPGESGVDFVYNTSLDFVENLGLEDFDIVGFDPRGVGGSGGLSCLTDQQNDKFIYLDYTPDDDREQELYDELMEIDEPCTEKFGKDLRFYSTENTARDMDLIRESMGFETINYLGISYGTYLGGVYATLFPDRVESMFLDSAYDPQGDTAEQDYLTQAEGFENAFNNWVDWCESKPSDCSFSSNDVKADWLELYDAYDAKSMFTEDDREVNAEVIDYATLSSLYSRWGWSVLADALVALRDGDATQAFALADWYVGRDEDGQYGDGYDSSVIINCASGTIEAVPKDSEALLKKIREIAPWYARDYDVDSFDGGYCESVFDKADLFEIDYQGDAPIVVLGGTDDPATPLRWAQEMATHMGTNASLLTFKGEGHSQIFNSRCVDEIARELFNSLRKPKDEVECEADVPAAKPMWWDDVVNIDGIKINQDTMGSYFGFDPIDTYAEYFEIEGSAEEVFAQVKAKIEESGWLYEQGASADSVVDVQWFNNPDDENIFVGVWLSSPDELEENQMVVPDGIVQPGSSVVMVYFWP
jgi:pimeloyl-ACP methyl ester carboxylesterase